MLLSNEDQKKYLKRVLSSRLRILCNQGFYGNLLMHMNFCLSEDIKNIAADSKRIYINPVFLDSISDKELDLVLLHEIMHLSLKHNFRKRDFEDKELFDTVADIVVNSNLLKSFDMKEDSITLNGKVLEHKLPNGKEGYEFSTEELYDVLYVEVSDNKSDGNVVFDDETGTYKIDDTNDINNQKNGHQNNFDDHSMWEKEIEFELAEKEWEQYNLDACEMMYIRDPSNSRGTIPGYAARAFKELREAKTDWRTLLNNFIQEEVNDYSFAPPDRRFDDSPFFLPDFNDVDEKVRGVLFMIDTSGSMSDSQITTAYSEVKGAIDQFDGKLQGWLGFFDASIIEPKEFTNEEEFQIIRPYGGGGTDFNIIFSYVKDKMQDKNISSIVILTDGYAPWPEEEVVSEIPTIWLINNEEVTPPWGKVARIPEDKKNDKYN